MNPMSATKDKKEQETFEWLPVRKKPWSPNMEKLIERSKRIRELEANESKYKYGEE